MVESPGEYERRAIRGVLAFGVLSGVAYLAAVPVLRPETVGLATDVYYHATDAALAGENPYSLTPPDRPGYSFVYPPLVVLAFVPHVLTGSELGAYLVQTILNLVTAGVLALVVIRATERAGGPLEDLDRLLIAGFVFGSAHTVSVLVMGQVNLQLALAVAGGAVLIERSRTDDAEQGDGTPEPRVLSLDSGRGETVAGVLVAFAAVVKLFPAAVGAWFLRLRTIRAAVAAIATGLAAFLAGIIAVGAQTTRTYLTDVLSAERHAGEFAGGLDPSAMYVTVRRPLAALLPSTDPSVLSVLALAVLAVPVLASYRDVSTRTGRQVALLATVLATLVYLPLEPFYYSLLYYPLVPLLYTLDPGTGRQLFVWGTVLLSTIVSYPAVEGILSIAPLSPGVVATVETAARAAFSVAQPPLLGAILLLVGCVVVQHDLVVRATGDPDDRGPGV